MIFDRFKTFFADDVFHAAGLIASGKPQTNSNLLFLLTSSPASVHFLTTDPLRFPCPPPRSDRSHNRFRSHRKNVNRSGNVPDAAPAHEVGISERIARSGYRYPKYSILLFPYGIPFRLSFRCFFLQFLFRHPSIPARYILPPLSLSPVLYVFPFSRRYTTSLKTV